MGLEAKLKEMGLTDEQIKGVLEGVKEEYKDHVAKEEVDKINTQLTEHKEMLKTRDKQLEELKNTGDKEMQDKIKELEEANSKTAEQYEQKLKEQAFNHALENALRDSKVKNVVAAKALLNTEQIELKEGKLVGYEEQIKAINETDPYLFNSEQQNIDTNINNVNFPQPGVGNPPGQKTPEELGKSLAERFNKRYEGAK